MLYKISHIAKILHNQGRLQTGIAQLVTFLTADTCLTADSGVTSSISAHSHTFVETDREMISMVIASLPLIKEGLVSVTSQSMFTKYSLTACRARSSLPRKKVWLGELTVAT